MIATLSSFLMIELTIPYNQNGTNECILKVFAMLPCYMGDCLKSALISLLQITAGNFLIYQRNILQVVDFWSI